MFSKRYHLFNLSGFPIELDASWFVIAVLLTWSLASGYFPSQYEALSTGAYWTMGVVGALGLFASIVLHELGHALVARRYDVPIRRIVLFVFGGVAQMEREPEDARSEFLVAIGGPIVSVALGLFFLGAREALTTVGSGPAAVGVAAYLALINFVVVGFNLVPAFPLDGGRVLRSALWAWKRDLRWATRVTSTIGSSFGFALIVLGVFAIVAGNFVAGLWWGLLGLFLGGAARMSYRQLLLRQALVRVPLSRFMTRDPVSVTPRTTVGDLIEDYVYRYHHKMFPVVQDGRLVGCVTLERIKTVPRDEWNERTVADIRTDCSEDNTIDVDLDAMEALARFKRSDSTRMLVVEGERLVGVLSLKDLMQFLSIKIELEREAA